MTELMSCAQYSSGTKIQWRKNPLRKMNIIASSLNQSFRNQPLEDI